ncbi:MAG: asparagine synthetase B, partial [Candidatus Staskawiczbacteria bacterium]|nr:asparagine synthetase B [Candidatus Staskawiczbacteria bacterium]
MCGIAGIYNFKNQPVDVNLLKVMAGVLAHRGPDDSGVFVKNHVGLGHTRLSIIDLSTAGHQPMANKDATLHIVFNGEIYNFK